jgi:hypothetical protein
VPSQRIAEVKVIGEVKTSPLINLTERSLLSPLKVVNAFHCGATLVEIELATSLGDTEGGCEPLQLTLTTSIIRSSRAEAAGRPSRLKERKRKRRFLLPARIRAL